MGVVEVESGGAPRQRRVSAAIGLTATGSATGMQAGMEG
jgi:hypothetical protein